MDAKTNAPLLEADLPVGTVGLRSLKLQPLQPCSKPTSGAVSSEPAHPRNY